MTILDQYNALREARRSYDHKAWHCVNVKRYHDYVKPEAIEAEAKRLTKNKSIQFALIAYGTTYAEDNDAYWSFLNNASNMLKEDIEECGRLSLKHIKQQGDKYKTYAYQLGRSGSWMCFEDTAEDIAEELEEDEDNKKRGIEDLLTPEDLADHIAGLTEAVKEIEALKKHIEDYNKGLKWSDEVFYRMSEHLEDLESEEADRLEDIRNEKEAIKNKDITIITLGALLSHDNDAIKRNAIGIMKQLNKK